MSKANRDLAEDSIGIRLSRYERSERLCHYVAGGIGGMILLVGMRAGAAAGVSRYLEPVVITAIVASAAAIGRAYVGFMTASYRLLQYQKRHGAADTERVPPDADLRYPQSSFTFFTASVIVLMVSAAVLLVSVWWSVLQR